MRIPALIDLPNQRISPTHSRSAGSSNSTCAMQHNFTEIPGFGVELKELQFDSVWHWFVNIDDFWPYWMAQKSYLFNQLAFFIGGFCTFIHAMSTGGRFRFLWLGILLHGLVVELAAYYVPHIDNFWHAQSPVDFLGRRLPLYILFLYPCFIYQASIAANKLKLPTWAEPCAVGIMAVMIDFPYDTTAIKFVHWIWHDTDPNIYDRFYWVPWNSYYFHATFAASFTFWFHGLRRWFSNKNKWESDSFCKELLLTICAALLGMPGGCLLFIPIYHPLHDIGKIHSENTFFMLFVVYLLVIWSADRRASPAARPVEGKAQVGWRTLLLLFHLVCHYSIFIGINAFLSPEDEVAIGLHEPVGNCHETLDVHTVFGMVLKKRKYLCLTDYDEKYYDFSCLSKLPDAGSIWYTVCGVAYTNRLEYICIMVTISTIAAVVMWNAHFRSAPDALSTSSGAKNVKQGKKRN